MSLIAVVAAAIAGLLHAYFFVLESVWFSRPAVYGRFGIHTAAEAETVRSFAYNQGFYNLFLAAGVLIGLWAVGYGDAAAGRAVVLFACGSMVAAGLVLVTHDRRFVVPALVQAVPPLIAIGATLFLT